MAETKARGRLTKPTLADRLPRRFELLAALAVVVIGTGILVGVPELRHCISLVLQGHFGRLRSYIRGLGAGGVGLVFALALFHAVLFYPAEIVTATSGYVFGFLPGLALVMTGWLACALVSYLLGRVLGRPILHAVLGRRFARVERAVEGGGVSLLIGARLIPVVPFSILGYVAGATHVRLWRFLWTTLIGFLPETVAVAYLGSHAQTLSLSDPVVWIVVLLLVALFASAQWIRIARK